MSRARLSCVGAVAAAAPTAAAELESDVYINGIAIRRTHRTQQRRNTPERRRWDDSGRTPAVSSAAKTVSAVDAICSSLSSSKSARLRIPIKRRETPKRKAPQADRTAERSRQYRGCSPAGLELLRSSTECAGTSEPPRSVSLVNATEPHTHATITQVHAFCL